MESCGECNKWCYTNNKCKGDSVDSLCVTCKKKSVDNVTSDKVSPMYSISPITTQCDPSKRFMVHEAIYSLLNGVLINQDCELNQYMTYFKRKLTHLDPKLHNFLLKSYEYETCAWIILIFTLSNDTSAARNNIKGDRGTFQFLC